MITGIGGKGGGRPNLAQGSLAGDVNEALSKLPKVVEEKLKVKRNGDPRVAILFLSKVNILIPGQGSFMYD